MPILCIKCEPISRPKPKLNGEFNRRVRILADFLHFSAQTLLLTIDMFQAIGIIFSRPVRYGVEPIVSALR